MPKNLSERIRLRTNQRKTTKRVQIHAAFLAQREQIKQSLADGWAIVHIWETLREEGKIETGYAAFCRRVKRMNLAHGAAITKASAAPGLTQPTKSGAPVLAKFTFESTPNEKELL